MQQIAHWLEKLGMSEYAQRFAETRIDFSVLPDLTDQDLKDLGVVLGDRRKILRAIAGLKSAEAVAPSPATEAVVARPQDVAERRQVTVMFSDPKERSMDEAPKSYRERQKEARAAARAKR